MRRLLIGIAALALSVAPSAGAKGLTQVRVCGESECVALEGPEAASVVTVTGNVPKPPAPGSYYRLDLSIESGTETQAFSNLFLPGEGLIAANMGAQRALLWYVPRTEALTLLQDAAHDLEPYEAPLTWPGGIDASDGWTSYAPLADDEAGWRPWALAAGALMIALSAGGLLAWRLRLRRPTTA